MTDSSPPPEPPRKPPAPRRLARAEHDAPARPESAPRADVPPAPAAGGLRARRPRPDLRDLPPPRADLKPNVWRADPPPAFEGRERREGPRRENGDAPRPDRAGERRARPPAAPRRDDPARDPGPADRRSPPRGPDRRAGLRRRDDDVPRLDDRRGRPAHPHGELEAARLLPDEHQAHYPSGPNERGPREDGRPPRPAEARRHTDAHPAPASAGPAPPPRPDQRLSKVMAERGLASRREADEWIDAGWVKVDGAVAVLGARVLPHQAIEIDPAARSQQLRRVTILLHKPIGYVSGQAEDGYEPASVLVTQANHWAEDPARERWHPTHGKHLAPAGRLDIDSTGLLVLTQDGRVARHLIGEDSDVEKEYLVRVDYTRGERLPDADLERLRHGLSLDGVRLKPAKVSWANEDQLRFVLREGRKRQIRRMCEAVGLVVTGLKRVRIGSVPLGKLPPGQWRYLREDERF